MEWTPEAGRPSGAVVATTVIETSGAGYRRCWTSLWSTPPRPRLVWAVEGHPQLRDRADQVPAHPRAGGGRGRPPPPARPTSRQVRRDRRLGRRPRGAGPPHQAIPRQDGNREGLRVLLVARASPVSSRTAAINSLKALVLTAPDACATSCTASQRALLQRTRGRGGRSSGCLSGTLRRPPSSESHRRRPLLVPPRSQDPYPIVPVKNLTAGTRVHLRSVRPPPRTVPPDRAQASSR